MKLFLFIIGLFLTAFLLYFCLSRHSVDIQRDIHLRLNQAIQNEGALDGITGVVSGRDITLLGAVSHPKIKTRAGEVAHALYGARVVDNRIELIEPPPLAIVEPEPKIIQDIKPPPVEMAVEQAPEPAVIPDLCQDELARILEGEKINFDSSRARIKAKSYGVLRQVIAAAKACEESTIHIHGYTDNSGDYDRNRYLSLNRAKSVGRYLVKYGVVQTIRVHGHGSKDPVATNETPEGRAQNRRIEFKIYKETR